MEAGGDGAFGMEFDAKELENNLNEQNNESVNNTSSIEDRKNSNI